jgi:hypothetical protein
MESFPPIKHQKINLMQGSIVEPVIKSSVTNFNHYISLAWNYGPTMQLGPITQPAQSQAQQRTPEVFTSFNTEHRLTTMI